MDTITAAQAAHLHRHHEAARLATITGLPRTAYWFLFETLRSRPAHHWQFCDPNGWLSFWLEKPISEA